MSKDWLLLKELVPIRYTSRFDEKVCMFCLFICQVASPRRQRTHCKLRATWEERESERAKISQRDFVWRNAGAVERKQHWPIGSQLGKEPIESGMS